MTTYFFPYAYIIESAHDASTGASQHHFIGDWKLTGKTDSSVTMSTENDPSEIYY